MSSLDQLQNKTRDLEQLYSQQLEEINCKIQNENKVLQEINSNYQNTIKNKEKELDMVKKVSDSIDLPSDLLNEIKTIFNTTGKTKRQLEKDVKKFKEFVLGNNKLEDSTVNEKLAKLEEENKELKRKKDKGRTAVLSKKNKELEQKILRFKEMEKQNFELKEENILLKESSVKKSSKSDELILMKSLLSEKEAKMKSKDDEIEKLKEKINSLTTTNEDFILPETSIAKNPYDKSFLMVQNKSNGKKKKKEKNQLNTAEKILSKENKSFFQDLSFCHSSPAAPSKNKFKK